MTRLGEAVHALAAGQADRSGIRTLPIPQEAFAARAWLARVAERSLDVQYYIWRNDTSGCLLLEELWNAAERGVRVRLLLDDNGIAGLDPMLAALDSHASIEVRLFNPFPNRRFKALGYVADFRRLNHRMHNKSFTADSAATIVGGRNIGNEYSGAGRKMLAADLDVLAVGRIASEVEAEFDRYWNDDSVRPVEAVVGRARSGGVAATLARFAAVRASAEAVEYVGAVGATRLVHALLAHDVPLEWAYARLMCDSPSKVKGPAPDAALLFTSLREALGNPEREIDLISPYFVPGEKGTAALAGFAEHGIAVRILTNSLAATDVGAVHAGYGKRRMPLLRSRARLYELKPDPLQLGTAEDDAEDRRGHGSSSASLHAKTFAVDRTRLFVGSMNLDPRSIRLNTEMGLLIESATLADAMARAFEQVAKHGAYEVVLAANGRLEWVEPTAGGELRYRAEPKTGFLRRLGVAVMARLPIEWLL